MACLGVHFALTDKEEAQLLDAVGNDDAVIKVIQEEIEDRWDEDWLQETDKAWDAIHRCLTDGTLNVIPKSPLHQCILGGRPLYSGDAYIISYLTAEEVQGIATAITRFGNSEIRDRYFKINESDYGIPLSQEDLDYTWGWFEPLKDFFAKAARANRAVVFTVDQ
ncbi:MAG: YfbM family protein [Planctomycetota bacterium]